MNSQELWTTVDDYIGSSILGKDPILETTLKVSAEAGLPPFAVSPPQGKFLQLLIQIQGAKNILEIGLLGGYSTIFMARGLPKDGRIVTLELEKKFADVARKNLVHAGVIDRVDIRVGPALDSLSKLADEKPSPFDFVFIDADKQNNPNYFTWALKLSRPGTIIIVDNVVREGRIVEPGNTDPSVIGTRQLNELIARTPNVSATTIQTVGSKGYDGFTLAVVS